LKKRVFSMKKKEKKKKKGSMFRNQRSVIRLCNYRLSNQFKVTQISSGRALNPVLQKKIKLKHILKCVNYAHYYY
jgi:hypothetical protein